jgi:alcohol dehydrogenase class IV
VRSFESHTGKTRIVFGSGTVHELAAELARLDAHHAVILSTPGQAVLAQRLGRVLGESTAGLFSEAAMHTPTAVTERAVAYLEQVGADAVVAVGGGSSTGLGKAVASRTGLPQLVVPTTYAGSEVTPVLGETADGQKTTRSSPEIQPDTVLYDVDLTLTLPWSVSLTSAVNAMAHAVEALYADERTEDIDRTATDALTALATGLRDLHVDRGSAEARSELLYGAWLAGACLGAVGMGLHHKLCHTLGGSFGLPHAPTHTVVLPYAMEYNQPAAPSAIAAATTALEVADGPAGVQGLIRSLEGPTALEALGFATADIPRAAELATARPYANPRPVTQDGVAELLRRATTGTPIGGDR